MTAAPSPPLIGVLALQGAYDAHVRTLAALGATPRLSALPPTSTPSTDSSCPAANPPPCSASSTATASSNSSKPTSSSTPTFGTCAGAILLATRVEAPAQRSLAALDITVQRNAYGRQIDSSILTAPTSLPGPPLEMVFIRAPRITRAGPAVETLASRDGFPTLVRSGHILAATFHPELSADPRVHQLFLSLVRTPLAAANKPR